MRCSLRRVIACQSAINGMFKNMSLLKTRFPGLLPNVVCIPTLALDAVPEVPRRPIQELFQVFFPWDQARTGPTSHEYKQGSPQRPQEPRVQEREQEETSSYPLHNCGR